MNNSSSLPSGDFSKNGEKPSRRGPTGARVGIATALALLLLAGTVVRAQIAIPEPKQIGEQARIETQAKIEEQTKIYEQAEIVTVEVTAGPPEILDAKGNPLDPCDFVRKEAERARLWYGYMLEDLAEYFDMYRRFAERYKQERSKGDQADPIILSAITLACSDLSNDIEDAIAQARAQRILLQKLRRDNPNCGISGDAGPPIPAYEWPETEAIFHGAKPGASAHSNRRLKEKLREEGISSAANLYAPLAGATRAADGAGTAAGTPGPLSGSAGLAVAATAAAPGGATAVAVSRRAREQSALTKSFQTLTAQLQTHDARLAAAAKGGGAAADVASVTVDLPTLNAEKLSSEADKALAGYIQSRLQANAYIAAYLTTQERHAGARAAGDAKAGERLAHDFVAFADRARAKAGEAAARQSAFDRLALQELEQALGARDPASPKLIQALTALHTNVRKNDLPGPTRDWLSARGADKAALEAARNQLLTLTPSGLIIQMDVHRLRLAREDAFSTAMTKALRRERTPHHSRDPPTRTS